jgi:hypothetical protein
LSSKHCSVCFVLACFILPPSLWGPSLEVHCNTRTIWRDGLKKIFCYIFEQFFCGWATLVQIMLSKKFLSYTSGSTTGLSKLTRNFLSKGGAFGTKFR